MRPLVVGPAEPMGRPGRVGDGPIKYIVCPLISKVVIGNRELSKKKFVSLPYGEFIVDGIRFIIEKKIRRR